MLWRITLTAAMIIIFSFIPAHGIARFVLYLVPYLLIGYDILAKAGRGILNRQVFDENFLMAIATVGALILGMTGSGDYVEAVAVMLFYQIGELFQSCALGKSRKSIGALMDIRPDYAVIIKDGTPVKVSPDEIAVGTHITVQPGEKIPLDGVVTSGTSTLDTSALTGESLPRDVTAGDTVISGSVNLSGMLEIRTTKEFGESTVSKILDLVENASSKKSKSEDFISAFARVYTPAVCFSAIVLAVIPPLVGLLVPGMNADFGVWLYRALTFLVASCPCALVVSIPLTFFAGIGGASREGILVKGSCHFEALAKTKCAVFDKTGTLTKGVFEVSEVHSEALSCDRVIKYAAFAECASSHPIAQSLCRAYGEEIDRRKVSDIHELSGHGVTASVEGHTVSVGNGKLMEKLVIAYDHSSPAGTVIHVAVDGTYAGYIVISDMVKPNSKAAVAELKCAGVQKTVMLTGDSKSVADKVAKSLGIDAVYSELLPADKVTKVEELLVGMPKDAKLAYIGDGINDAPVLSRADIGIAMGAMGSDAAIESADVVLMDDDPAKLAKTIKIARKCIGIVKQNIAFAISVKLVSLILVAIGAAGMWLAVFADVGVMILAVFNAIRALFVKKL